MNSKEFIKERTSYKIGYCVKLSRELSKTFPPTEIYTIIGFSSNTNGELCYILDRNAPLKQDRIYHYSYVFRDDECKKMERKLKLESLNKFKYEKSN